DYYCQSADRSPNHVFF
nr:immunoglobulin light chain junction region [Macaca mulatta]MOV66454.1 immunoglobulin light chain junction region [Macaca mulatta]MOV66498.1 immunoglobulin light chain junction region [Macaca mulatta]MOV66747.1 immunoglobulin light chain junction region [Macaca mulatta]MOV66982.1 immunoglobulin light chain junction region [Macaca mulatta]